MTSLQKTASNTSMLGHKIAYPTAYNPSLLQAISRSLQRDAMGFSTDIRWQGFDIWNAYELSWLNSKAKPIRALASFLVPATSPMLAESKSVKLFLNSLNSKRFDDQREVKELIARDLSAICQAPVEVELNPQDFATLSPLLESDFFCLDNLDLEVKTYLPDSALLRSDPKKIIADRVVSHIFKSHCLVTGQPDWGSVFIDYQGPAIDRLSLLAYLVSFNQHAGFSENCIEQIYRDILSCTKPERLLVFGRFSRRGGIDINPYRANFKPITDNKRMIFQ